MSDHSHANNFCVQVSNHLVSLIVKLTNQQHSHGLLFTLHQDDSGGPLMVSGRKGRFVLAGVTSFGRKKCSNSGYSGFYANVASVVDWIGEIINGGA